MTPIERFENSYIPVTESGCYLWLKFLDKDGYGGFALTPRKNVRAHRFSYETFVGPLGSDELVLHKCDNPCCVRPEHLEKGSQSKNIKDSFARGRSCKKGSKHHMSKLTEEEVLEMRSSYSGKREEIKAFSEKHGINFATVYDVLHRRTWRHV